MNATDYLLFVREYSIWNTAVATLQFWRADLESHILSSAIEWVYAAFFYTTFMHLLHDQPKEVLFSCFVTMLNDAFGRELALEGDGCESGSETSNLPTPLRRTSRIHHISSDENISFNPSTLCTSQAYCKPVHHWLLFGSLDDEDISAVHNSSDTSSSLPLNSMSFIKPTYTRCDDFTEEDFQTVALDDDHWITDPVPDRHLCIHQHSQPHSLGSYPCPYADSTPALYQDTLDLSDISDLEDVMTTSCDEDIPALDDVFWLWNQQTMVCIQTFISPINRTHTILEELGYLYHTFCIQLEFVYTLDTFTIIHLWYVSCIGYLYIYTFIYDMSFVFNATALK